MEDKPTVFVVDDDNGARDSVMALVSSMGVAVEGFESAEQFLEKISTDQQGCLVCDMRLRGINGVELLETLNKKGYSLPVIIITGFASTNLTVKAIKDGAVTLLEKPCEDQQLWDAIRTAIQEGAKKSEENKKRNRIVKLVQSLTPAEKLVMDMVIAGKANKVIAFELNVSVRTIESRRANVFKKMGVDSVAELVRLVIEMDRDSGAA